MSFSARQNVGRFSTSQTASLGHTRGDFPHAEAAASSVLALPIYGELTLDQQTHVVDALADALRG